MKLVVALSCLLIHVSQCGKVSRRSVLGESCTTPYNHPGDCRNIDNCQELRKVRKDLVGERSADASAFLRDSRCGSTGVYPPLYCCPLLSPKCGNGGPMYKAFGGGPAEPGAWPWIAALGYLVNPSLVAWKCGGSLVTDSHVLTAAHCINENLYQVRLGDLDLDDGVKDHSFPVTNIVESTILHPKYKADPPVNDIAVIKMKDRVKITDLIQPICLPNAATPLDSLVGELPYVVGWGLLGFGRTKPTALQQAYVPVTSNENCRRLYLGKRAIIDEKVICAGNIRQGTCEGDSGGPLMYAPSMYKGKFVLVGVVSYGLACGKEDAPTVYMNVSSYIDWIHENLD